MMKKWKIEDLNLKDEILSYYPLYKYSFWNINNPDVCLKLIYINLSNNKLTSLPKKLGTLPFLVELKLSQNRLGMCDQSDWLWMEQITIRSKLAFLDLSSNSFTELPEYIWNLRALTRLKVCHNLLTNLSQRIQNLNKLSILDLSYNRLLYLPGCFTKMMMLFSVNISENLFTRQRIKVTKCKQKKELTLIELSGQVILKNRISYDYLPHRLVLYLNKMESCLYCKKLSLRHLCVRVFIQCTISMIAEMVKFSSNPYTEVDIEMECYYCCKRCQKYNEIELNYMLLHDIQIGSLMAMRYRKEAYNISVIRSLRNIRYM